MKQNHKKQSQNPTSKAKEIAETMVQTSKTTDPLGSYTGTSVDTPNEKPTQDADDL
ncbi:MAG: hypothetical protein FWF76_04315 [Oscillospiraceae bacterium]|nr:hypothetical protein [Oscillospiraceae bacterium]